MPQTLWKGGNDGVQTFYSSVNIAGASVCYRHFVIMCLSRAGVGWETFPVKDQIVNSLGFARSYKVI